MITVAALRELFSKYLPADSIRKRFAMGSFWSLVGAVISQGLAVVASIITARLLGKAAFGEVGIILSTVGMLTAFAAMGLGLTANKHIAELRVSDPERAGRIIGMSSLAAFGSGSFFTIVMLVIAPELASRVIAAPHLTPELRLGSLILLLSALNGAQIGALSGFEAFKTIAQANLVAGLLNFPLMIGGVYLWGLPGAVGGQAAGMGATWIVNHIALRRECRKARVIVSYRGIGQELPILWKFSLPAVLSGLVTAFANWGVATLLVNQPGGYEEMGIFRAANQWRMSLLFLPQVFAAAITPIMANTFGQGRERSTVKVMAAAMVLNLVVILIPGGVVGTLSPWIMSQYGAGFEHGWPVLVWCLVSAGLLSIMTPVGTLLVASSRMWTGMLMNLGWATILLASAWWLRSLGAMGLAFAYAGSYCAHGLWVSGYAYWLIRKNHSDVFVLALKSSAGDE
jgi:O-antigen/teichoic acid export membrane protein